MASHEHLDDATLDAARSNLEISPGAVTVNWVMMAMIFQCAALGSARHVPGLTYRVGIIAVSGATCFNASN